MKRVWMLLALTGCATVSPVYGPDGKAALLVECGGSVSNCYRAAEERCKGPYSTISRDGTVVPYLAPGLGGGGGVRRFELMVRCH